MAEDQGVNGDIWNDEASALFQALGWSKIADSNIDIPGVGDIKHGIDSIFAYKDGFNPVKDQGVFIEAKRYATGSFSPKKLDDWISKMDMKLRELKFGNELYDRYPIVDSLNISNSVLAIWFHDLENYISYKEKLREALLAVKTPRTRGPSTINRLFVLENDHILRLASLVDSVQKWNSALELGPNTFLQYYYPASSLSGFAGRAEPVLNLEYMYSSFIFAKSQMLDEERNLASADVVFYFGKLDMNNLLRLREAMLTFEMITKNNHLYLYLYQRSDEFRKIRPDVEDVFNREGPVHFEIRMMERFGDLPTWMKNT